MALEENSMLVTFYEDALYNKSESRRSNTEIFQDTLMLRIKQINSVDEVIRPATDVDVTRFKNSYNAFKAGVEAPEEGTPLKDTTQFTPAEIKMLAAHSIKTVETLAEVADGALSRMGPGMVTLKSKAQKYMDSKSQISRMAEENRALKARLDALEASKPAKKKLGRPKKKKVASVAADDNE